jgi:putative transposase
MSYRTIEIHFKPSSHSQWQSLIDSRKEAARLWNDLVERHYRIRRLQAKWPAKFRWFRWAKGRYPGLSAQSAQQIISDFCEAVESTRQLRKSDPSARYPWHKFRYRNVIYTNQDARIRNDFLILPNGTSGTLRIRMPKTVTLPGRLMEVRLGFCSVSLVCEVEEEIKPTGPTIGVDLGVNTLIAATDGETAVLVSGRQVKSITQGRNKALASFQTAQSKKTKGSRRWKQLQRKKRRMLERSKRRIKDACHKATRQIANAFPSAKCYVGKPFNDASQKCGHKNAQQVSQACNAKIIAQLDYKTSGAIEVNESYSSQTCPVCGRRKKCRRVYSCKCGVIAPRDVVGSVNIRSIGMNGELRKEQQIPKVVKYLRPLRRSSSGGHPASCSAIAEKIEI